MSGIDKIGSSPAYQSNQSKTRAVDKTSYKDTFTTQAVDKLIGELEQKYGYKISAQNIQKGQQSIEKYAMSNSCTKIAIAPNILEGMVSNSSLRQKIEGKFADMAEMDKSLPQRFAAIDRVYIASGMVVHEDGTTTYWVMSDDTPEKKAQIKKAMDAEAEAKAERRERYQELAEQTQEKRILMSASTPELFSKIAQLKNVDG